MVKIRVLKHHPPVGENASSESTDGALRLRWGSVLFSPATPLGRELWSWPMCPSLSRNQCDLANEIAGAPNRLQDPWTAIITAHILGVNSFSNLSTNMSFSKAAKIVSGAVLDSTRPIAK